MRNATRAAAAAERVFHDTEVALVARQVADELRVWSEPVQVMVEPDGYGLLNIIVRPYQPAEVRA